MGEKLLNPTLNEELLPVAVSREGKSVFFRGVAPGGLPMSQCMVPQPRVHGQH